MFAETLCPACGAAVPEGTDTCPHCGFVLLAPADPTLLSAASRFANGAEAMDEVKRLLRVGKKMEAIQTHRAYFSLSLEEAQRAVDAIESDLGFSAPPPPPAADDQPPAFARPAESPVNAQTVSALPEMPLPAAGRPAWQKWLIGCSVALVLFCCLCVLLPIVIFIFTGQQG